MKKGIDYFSYNINKEEENKSQIEELEELKAQINLLTKMVIELKEHTNNTPSELMTFQQACEYLGLS
ncbi:MAG: hypothetical protein M1480_13000 [Bacteroidetes bacterium]|nr:hypothetical protein [Bacteroidota bacterium]